MHSEIVVILDRSGSMTSIASDMEGGLNSFIEEQKNLDEDGAKLTLARFDAEYELVHDGIPLADAPHISLEPRGMTALLDAVGKTVSTVNSREHAEKVIVLIITDGLENSSREWKREAVKQLVGKCTADGWEFVYLGANVEAFDEAGGIGVSMRSTMNYTPDSASVKSAFAHTSMNIATTRSGGGPVSYSSTQRESTKRGEAEKAASRGEKR